MTLLVSVWVSLREPTFMGPSPPDQNYSLMRVPLYTRILALRRKLGFIQPCSLMSILQQAFSYDLLVE